VSALPYDDLARAAQEAAGDALAVFIDAARSSPDERIRLEAARAIRDWAYGKPGTADVPAPQPEQASDEPMLDADFWAMFCNSELMIWLLEVTREVRARKLENGARHYSREFGIPLIEPPPPQRKREPVIAEAQHEQLDLPLPDPDLEPLAAATTTPRSPTPGPGEIVIDSPGELTVPYLGYVYHLKIGRQIGPAVLANHNIVKRFIPSGPAA
jgi:hypothetical protein